MRRNRASASSPPARPISTCGRRSAELGITEQRAASLGIRVYKVAMTWPLEPQGALAFAQNLKDILVVEEKRGFVENQVVKLSL